MGNGKKFLVALVVVIIGVVVFVNRKPTIDLNKYVEITFDGYDTVGRASSEFNREAFRDQYGDKLKYNKKALKKMLKEQGWDRGDIKDQIEMMEYEYSPVDYFMDYVSGDLDKTSQLKNGDTVVFSWYMSEQEQMESLFNCKIKFEDITEHVTGLQEAQAFDPFEGVEVVYGDYAPNGTASVKNKRTDEPYCYLRYKIDKSSELSNGDQIVVSVESVEEDLAQYCLSNFGMIPSSEEKTFTVEGLSGYALQYSEISEDMLGKMKQQAEDVINADAADWNDEFKLNSIEYVGNYFLVNKDFSYIIFDTYNHLTLVYRVNLTYTNGEFVEPYSYYTCVTFADIMVLEDKTCSVDLARGELTVHRVSKEFDPPEKSIYISDYFGGRGYEDLDSLFNNVITKNIAEYTYEENMEVK